MKPNAVCGLDVDRAMVATVPVANAMATPCNAIELEVSRRAQRQGQAIQTNASASRDIHVIASPHLGIDHSNSKWP